MKENNKNIVLRFAVMSDTHYNEKHPFLRERFEKALKTVYGYAEGEEYKNLDALYVVGDFTDLGLPEQFRMFKEDCDKFVKPETKLVVTLANHELHYNSEELAMETFKELFKMAPDRHEVIGGYHFISLSGCKYKGTWHDSFNEEKREFLKTELEKARKESKGKPIFVFQHPGIAGTVQGGTFGHKEILNILKNYPQVVDFSGHSHNPVNDPREIDQHYFTAVSTGSLFNLGFNHASSIYAYGEKLMKHSDEYSQMLVCEVDDKSRVYIKKLDVLAGGFFEDDYVLDNFTDVSAFKYTSARAKDAEKPCFDKGAAVSVTSENGKTKISFPAAHGIGERVREYHIVLSDSDGVFYQTVLVSDFASLVQKETVELTLPGIEKENIKAMVRASGFWGNTSEAIYS